MNHRSDKSGMSVVRDDDAANYEMGGLGKYAGTDQDYRDMRKLGKTQVLNVSTARPINAVNQCAHSRLSAIFASYQHWASLAL